MIDLSQYGFHPTMLPENAVGIPARVTAVHRERYELVCRDGLVSGRLKTAQYYGGGEPFPTAGDFVLIDQRQGGECRILKTLPRHTFFSRSDPSSAGGEQAVAANFDYVFVMQSLNHDLNIRRLERYLTLSWQSGATPLVVLTKADLLEDHTAQLREIQAAAAGVSVYPISTKTGYGMAALADYLKPGKTIVFLGSSGVGKSSLVNALAGEDVMPVNGIRERDGRGRHTTTHRQLLLLKSGVMVIDTPGMRELGMVGYASAMPGDVTQGLGQSFADVETYFGQCKFADCKHQNEPGCAIQAAIRQGALPAARWNSYVNLKKESRYSGDKAAFLRQKQQWHKDIAKRNKQRLSGAKRYGGKAAEE